MEVQDYRADGYNLSQYIDQKVLSRAEADIQAAYLAPFVSDYDAEEEPYRSAIMVLSYLCIMQRQAVATRAGGKSKFVAQSATPTQTELREQYARQADLYLRQIDGFNPSEVNDICGIYFKSNYFYTN